MSEDEGEHYKAVAAEVVAVNLKLWDRLGKAEKRAERAELMAAEASEALHMANLNIPGWEDAVERAQASIRAAFEREL